jgi:hypothetical protein
MYELRKKIIFLEAREWFQNAQQREIIQVS